jgi:hypothetical protein
MGNIKDFDKFVNESHGWDKELEDARMMQGSAKGLTSWAERKIAESRPENFKEGVINPVQEELTLPINDATDMNDPVLIAARAMKDRVAKEKALKALDMKKRVYGKRREKMEDDLRGITEYIGDLMRERSMLYQDMELEAGQIQAAGGQIDDEFGNRYGEELNRVESELEKLKAKRDKIETALSY